MHEKDAKLSEAKVDNGVGLVLDNQFRCFFFRVMNRLRSPQVLVCFMGEKSSSMSTRRSDGSVKRRMGEPS